QDQQKDEQRRHQGGQPDATPPLFERTEARTLRALRSGSASGLSHAFPASPVPGSGSPAYVRFFTMAVTCSDADWIASLADWPPCSAFWISVPMAVVTCV